MKENKNIDRLFQEKFKDFEAAPNEKVWKNIKSELQKENDRKVIPIWWYRIAGVAAVLAMVFLAGNFWLDSNENQVVNSIEEIKEEDIQKKPETPFTSSESKNKDGGYATGQNTIEKTENIIQPQTSNPKNSQQEVANTNTEHGKANSKRLVEKSSTVASNSSSNSGRLASTGTKNSETEDSSRIASAGENTSEVNSKESKNQQNLSSSIAGDANSDKQSTSTEKNSLAENTSEEENSLIDKNKTGVEENEEDKKSLVDTAKEIEEDKDEEKSSEEKENDEQHLSKWLIKPNVSPIYYGSLNGGNSLDKSLANNSSSGELTMAYGVNFAYSISEKLKVRSGVSKVNMSYNVNNIAFSPAVNAIQLEGLNYPSNESIEVVSTNRPQPNSDAITNEFGRAETPTFSQGTLNQQLGYIEVPLEIEYALLNKKFGVNLIGGASTLFLDNNAVVINSGEGQLSLGEANNLNNVSFTTNVGLGLNYNLSQQFDLNLEPTFKYQLNGFNNNINNFKPYYFGVYTGFSFKF